MATKKKIPSDILTQIFRDKTFGIAFGYHTLQLIDKKRGDIIFSRSVKTIGQPGISRGPCSLEWEMSDSIITILAEVSANLRIAYGNKDFAFIARESCEEFSDWSLILPKLNPKKIHDKSLSKAIKGLQKALEISCELESLAFKNTKAKKTLKKMSGL